MSKSVPKMCRINRSETAFSSREAERHLYFEGHEFIGSPNEIQGSLHALRLVGRTRLKG